MKKMKIFATALVCLALAAGCAFAAKNGGFAGKGSEGAEKTVTVSQAKKLRDDTHVVLEGRITKQLGHERYTFQDSTGTITVEIDDDDWHGLTVDESDHVRIYGEVDVERGKTEIEVDRIELAGGQGNDKKGGFEPKPDMKDDKKGDKKPKK